MSIGADLAKKFRENDLVVNAIMAHHNDVEPARRWRPCWFRRRTPFLRRVRARAASRWRITSSVWRSWKPSPIPSTAWKPAIAIQSGREVRIIVKPEDVNDAGTLILAKEIVKKIEREMEYPGQIKVNVIRETRAVDFAK